MTLLNAGIEWRNAVRAYMTAQKAPTNRRLAAAEKALQSAIRAAEKRQKECTHTPPAWEHPYCLRCGADLRKESSQ
jgi:hypothetical protein